MSEYAPRKVRVQVAPHVPPPHDGGGEGGDALEPPERAVDQQQHDRRIHVNKWDSRSVECSFSVLCLRLRRRTESVQLAALAMRREMAVVPATHEPPMGGYSKY